MGRKDTQMTTDHPDLDVTPAELMGEHGVAGAITAPPRPDDSPEQAEARAAADALEAIADPIDRAKAAGELADYHAQRQMAFAMVRAEAVRQALETIPKATQASVAAALGISKGMVGKIISRHKEG
jgi:hypothetical protein